MPFIAHDVHAQTATPDHVHQDAGSWFFWDEAYADRHGPFTSEPEARGKAAIYILDILAAVPPISDL